MSLADFDRLGAERDLWVGRYEREQVTCKECGRPIAECADHERTFYPFRRVCYATMEREAAEAAYAARHEDKPWHDGTFTSWSKERSDSHPYRFDSGVMIGVADHDLTPWDYFTTRESASPIPPGSDEVDPDVDEGTEDDQPGDDAGGPDRVL